MKKECRCGHAWEQHTRHASGAEPCRHFGCGCADFAAEKCRTCLPAIPAGLESCPSCGRSLAATLQDKLRTATRHVSDLRLRGMWAEIDQNGEDVRVRAGYVLSDGTEERCILTRTYYGNDEFGSAIHYA